jgi:hypothetical protein
MPRRTGGSTNAAPSALKTSQAQSEAGSLPAGRASQTQPASSTPSTEQASQPASSVESSQLKPDVQEKPAEQSTASGDGQAPVAESDLKPADQVDSDGQPDTTNQSDESNKLSTGAAEQLASDADADDLKVKGNSEPDNSISALKQAEPEYWTLRVRNLTACRFYEPFSNVHLEPHRITEIKASTLKAHQQVKANIQELARLKKGKLEIIND